MHDAPRSCGMPDSRAGQPAPATRHPDGAILCRVGPRLPSSHGQVIASYLPPGPARACPVACLPCRLCRGSRLGENDGQGMTGHLRPRNRQVRASRSQEADDVRQMGRPGMKHLLQRRARRMNRDVQHEQRGGDGESPSRRPAGGGSPCGGRPSDPATGQHASSLPGRQRFCHVSAPAGEPSDGRSGPVRSGSSFP